MRRNNYWLSRIRSTIVSTASIFILCVAGNGDLTAADDFPQLRSGLWEYQRTMQRSDENWSPKDITVRECQNPIRVLQKQNDLYRKLGCAIATTRVTESTYQVTADCPTTNGIKV